MRQGSAILELVQGGIARNRTFAQNLQAAAAPDPIKDLERTLIEIEPMASVAA